MRQPGERTVVVAGPPPPRPPASPARPLARMLRVVDAGPRPFFQAALVSLTLTAGVAISIALQVRSAGPLPWPQRDVITICLGALGVVGVLTLVTVVVPARLRAALIDRLVSPQQRAAIWLALTVWFPLLAVVAYYRCRATLPPTQVWVAFGYQDKRWLTATYLLGALAPMLLLVAATRVLEAGRAHPVTWRSWLRDLTPRRWPDAGVARAGLARAGLASTAAGAATSGTVTSGTVTSGTATVGDATGAGAGAADGRTAGGNLADAGPGNTGATVTGATVTGATVTGATVTGATVTGATVTGATVTGATVPAGSSTSTASAAAATAATRRGFPGAGLIRVTAGLLTALALAYYFYGPPWYLNRTSGSVSIGYQEDLYLGGLQAISKGAVPYIGPAAIQYGPGSQWLSYEYMRHFATFSVVGFRESWAMFEWVGASILFVVFFLALGYFRGLTATLLSALIYPALHLMEFVPGRSYTGFFGWASPLRYAGAIALLLLLPGAIRRAPAWRGLAGAFVLGLTWGLLSYVAQENLAAGAVGTVVLSALLLLSGTASRRSVLSSLLAVLGGFIVSWLPVVLFYAGKGLLTRFFYLYFLITRAVAEGYSNTPYGWPRSNLPPVPAQIAISSPLARMYHVLPFVLAVLALLAVLQFGPFRVAMEWSAHRVMLVSLLLTAILLYQGAMLRSDADHLTGTLLVVPFLVVTAATVLPRQLGIRRRPALVLAGVVLFAASFLLLPSRAYKLSSIGGQAEAPWLDRQQLAAEKDPAIPPALGMAAQRVGPGVWDRPACCQRFSEPMSSFIQLANQLHYRIGNRVTYVDDFQAGYPGIIYFLADLRPAPVPLDEHTMVFTQQQNQRYLGQFRRNVVPRTQALVTDNIWSGEAIDFERHYKHYQRIELRYRGSKPIWVLLSTPGQFSVQPPG